MKKSMALGRDYIISINDSDLKVGFTANQKYSVKTKYLTSILFQVKRIVGSPGILDASTMAKEVISRNF